MVLFHGATIFYHLRLCHIDKRIVAVNTFNCSSSSILQYIRLKNSQEHYFEFRMRWAVSFSGSVHPACVERHGMSYVQVQNKIWNDDTAFYALQCSCSHSMSKLVFVIQAKMNT